MPQLFKKRADIWLRIFLGALVLTIAIVIGFLYVIDLSSYNTYVDLVREQPVPFSHEHHVGGLGIECQYCHTSVEVSRSAGMPAASICMNCHQQIWTQSPLLELVRKSYDEGVPIPWNRVYDLPDFTYFNHSIHYLKGIGCESCHGRVDTMPLLYRATSLKMQWCLDCHWDPAKNVRPRDQVTTMGWTPPEGSEGVALRKKLANEYNLQIRVDCYTCHR